MRPRILIPLLLALASCGGDYSEDYEKEGRQAFHLGDFGVALDKLSIALRADPGDPELRYMVAVSELRMRRAGSAVRRLQSLMEEPRFRSRAVKELAGHLLARGRLEEARRRVLEGLEHDADDLELLEVLGDVRYAVYERSLEEIIELLDRFLGEGNGRAYEGPLRWLVASPPEHFDDRFGQISGRLAREEGFAEDGPLKERVMKARADLRQALDQIGRVVRRDPTNYRLRIVLAEHALEAGDVPTALEHFEQVTLTQASDIANVPRRRGLERAKQQAVARVVAVHNGRDDHDAAVEFLESAKQRVKDEGALDVHLAALYFDTGRIDELAGLVDGLIARNPRGVWPTFYKGYVLYHQALDAGGAERKRRMHEAVSYLERAHASVSDSGLFNRWLALALKEVGDLTRAINRFEDAVDRGPVDAGLVIAYAETWHEMGQPRRALEVLGNSLYAWLRHDPEGRKEVEAAHARLLQQHGYGIEDLPTARRLRKEYPDNVYITLQLAEMEREAGFYERAVMLVEEVQRKAPDVADAWLVGARVELAQGNHARAIRNLDRLESLEGERRADAAWMRAAALLGLDRHDEAREAAERALLRDPAYVRAARLLVEIHTESGEWQHVETIAAQHLERFPEDRELLEALARARTRLGRWDAAVEALERLQDLEPEGAQTVLELGRCLIRAGRTDEGRARLVSAAALAPPERPDLALAAVTALVESGAPDRAAPLLEQLLPRLEGAGRSTALAAVMVTRHVRGDTLGVLEAAVELRRLGREDLAIARFVRLGSDAGAHREVAAAFDVVGPETQLEEETLLLAAEANVEAGQHGRALGILHRIEPSGADAAGRVLVARARALLGLDRLADVSKLLGGASGRIPADVQPRLWAVWARAVYESSALEAFADDLERALAMAPQDPDVHLVAARAAEQSGDLSRAVTLVRRALELSPDDPEIRRTHAALLAAAGRYRDARAAPPADPSAAALLELLAGGAPADGTFAAFLKAAGARDFPRAHALADQVRDLPETCAARLHALVSSLERSPEGAGLIVEPLARAALYRATALFPDRADRELARLEGEQEETAGFTRIFRAWVLASFDRGKEAAGIVVPMLEEGRPDGMLLFVTGLAALINGGQDSLDMVLDGLAGKGRIAPDLAVDLARALSSRGGRAAAHTLLGRAEKPVPEGVALKIDLALADRDLEAAQPFVPLLVGRFREIPRFTFLIRWDQVKKDPGNVPARRSLARLLRDAALWEDIDPLIVAEVCGDLRLDEELDRVCGRILARRPYDAPTLAALRDLTERFGRPIGLRKRLEAGLTVVDPAAVLRHREPRGTARRR